MPGIDRGEGVLMGVLANLQAGGDLEGTYLNPTIREDAISVDDIVFPLDVNSDDAADDLIKFGVTGDTNDRFVINANGTLEWGPGDGSLDRNLYRYSSEGLKTDDYFYAEGNIVAQQGNAGQVYIGSDYPYIAFGLAFDTTLYRDAVGTLLTNGIFGAGSEIVARWGQAEQVALGSIGAGVAGLAIGADVFLYRSGVNILKTDGKSLAVGGIGVGNSAAATTLGTVTKKMEVFNSSGASLGFVPIYDAIT